MLSCQGQIAVQIPAGKLTWPPIVATTFAVLASFIDSNMFRSLQIWMFAELSQMIVTSTVSS